MNKKPAKLAILILVAAGIYALFLVIVLLVCIVQFIYLIN